MLTRLGALLPVISAGFASSAFAMDVPEAEETPAVPEDPLIYEGAAASDRERLRESIDELSEKRFLHGFRIGYIYLTSIHSPIDSADPDSPSLAEKYGIKTPHQFLLGYEATWRLIGHEWLNILLMGNLMVAGLEQSKVFPSANGIIGFEISQAVQVGVGVNVMPSRDKIAHMLIATGWTPRVGDFYLPLHAFVIPDVDGQHRVGMTLGVNW